jgi:hypothetical protein
MSKQLEDAKRRAQDLLGQIKGLRDAAADSNCKFWRIGGKKRSKAKLTTQPQPQ